MSKFQSTVSTLAALASIAVTTVGVYKAVENNKQHVTDQQKQIEQLKTQLKQEPPQVQPQVEQPPKPLELPPVAQPVAETVDSAQTPPPVPSLPIRQ
jgi:hypothetical protein